MFGENVNKLNLSHLILWPLVMFHLVSCNQLLSNSSRRENRPDIAPLFEPTPTPTPAPIVRPDNQVFIDSTYCVCLNGESDSINGNCPAFCNDKNVTLPTLFATASLGPDIELNDLFGPRGRLNGWCNNEIPDGNINPSCILEAVDDIGQIRSIDVSVSPDQSTFTAVVQDLPRDQTFILRLVERSSGSSSNAFQVRRKLPSSPTPPEEILLTEPVNLYSCLNTASLGDPPNILFTAEQLFTYNESNRPQALPPSAPLGQVPNIYCHDIIANDTFDSPAFPRLNLRNEHFRIWNSADPRFFDLDGNNSLDVNDTIQQRVTSAPYNFLSSNIVVFTEFNWPNSPLNTVSPTQGYVIIPFVDSVSNDVFCPNQNFYNNFDENNPSSFDALMEIVGDLIGVDTEALYLAKKEPEIFQDGGGNPIPAPDSFMPIREGLLQNIGIFFLNNGQAVQAQSDADFRNRTIHFYWPPCQNLGCLPTIRQAGQKLYTVRSPSELNGDASQPLGFRTSISPEDKRIGCVPTADQ